MNEKIGTEMTVLKIARVLKLQLLTSISVMFFCNFFYKNPDSLKSEANLLRATLNWIGHVTLVNLKG